MAHPPEIAEDTPVTAQALAASLAKRVGAVVDPHVRVAYIGHLLDTMDPAAVADVITVATAACEARDPDHAALLLAISLALVAPEREALRESIVAAAAARAQHDVVRLLRAHAPAGGPEPDEQRVPDFGRGRPLTLGERKTLARRSDRNLLARVIRDPHPDVIAILLGNPALTEDDVVRLCARRPIAPEALRTVFMSTRWIVRYRVRLAMVRNPFCPVELAMQLVPHLSAQDAREVAASPELAEAVRDACKRAHGDNPLH